MFFNITSVYVHLNVPPASVRARNWSILSRGANRECAYEGPSRPRRLCESVSSRACISQRRAQRARDATQPTTTTRQEGDRRASERDKRDEMEKKGQVCPAIHYITTHTHKAYPRPPPRPYRPMTGMRSFY